MEPLWNPRGTLWNPLKPYLAPPSHTPRRTSTAPQPLQNLVQQWWNPGRTLAELLWNLLKRLTLAELPQITLAEPGKLWWNCRGTLHHPGPPRSPRRTWWNPGGNFVEPSLKPPQTTPQPSQKMAEPWWNPRGTLPQATPDHPVALAEPGGSLVKPRSPCRTRWNPGGTCVEPDLKPPRNPPQPSQNLVEPW